MNILIAEDNSITAKLLGRVLLNENYVDSVKFARTGQEALEIAEKENIDVIILDLTLPVIDGFEVINTLYAHKTKAKILVLSAHDESKYITRALKMGAKGYINKGRVLDELKEAVQQVQDGGMYLCESTIKSFSKENIDYSNLFINRYL